MGEHCLCDLLGSSNPKPIKAENGFIYLLIYLDRLVFPFTVELVVEIAGWSKLFYLQPSASQPSFAH